MEIRGEKRSREWTSQELRSERRAPANRMSGAPTMSSVGGMFGQKSLTDIVKGIRATKRDTGLFISACIAEIKTEISSTDPKVKATALQKLTFLQMMGYDMSFASFATIEVMSNVRFAHKRVGYLAASQGFSQNTEVVLLTTNLLKKELRGAVGGGMSGVYEAGLAVNCLSNIVTEDLARELLPDLTNLLSHPQQYIQKKAVLCMFKLFVKYPQGLRLTFSRIQQCLDDSNPSVVSCAVNVITELSDKNPKNYLPLAPSFFNLLTSSSNNWMLIKVVKLLGSLVAEEPRLARKLLDPLAEIVKTTQAKSLLYEAVYTITLCLPYCRKADGSMPASVPAIVELCARTLRSFVEDADQNLKYLGLVGFASLMSSHPKVLSTPDYRPLILACLSDDDITIRSRSLDLLGGMATRKNLIELVNQLLKHVDQAVGSYKSDLVEKIIEICSAEKYAHLQDFAWYLDVLVYFGHTIGIERSGQIVARQIVDVALRVLPVRLHAVKKMMEVLDRALRCRNRFGRRENILEASRKDPDIRHETCGFVLADVLPAAAWIVGEYSSLIPAAAASGAPGSKNESVRRNFQSSPYHSTIVYLTCPLNSSDVPFSSQTVFVQSAMKVFVSAYSDPKCVQDEVSACKSTLDANLAVYTESPSPEVKERALSFQYLLARHGLVVENSFCRQKDRATIGVAPFHKEGSASGVMGDLLLLTSAGDPKGCFDTLTAEGRNPSILDESKEDLGVTTIPIDRTTSTIALRYTLVSEPMKPVSAKAQKKKSQTPPKALRVTTDDGIDFVSFDGILGVVSTKEFALRCQDANFEAVSFTQQHFPQAPTRRSDSFMDDQTSNSAITISASSFQLNGDAGLRFEDESPLKIHEPRSRAHKQNDPFYLDVDSNTGSSTGAALVNQPGKFGSILLTDSNEESKAQRKKKKHKKKNETRKRNASTSAQSGVQRSTSESAQAAMGEGTGQYFTVYRSDDDDCEEEEVEEGILRKMAGDKEFEGLRKIDLSAAATVEEEEEVAAAAPVLQNGFPEKSYAAKVEKASKRKGGDREKTKKKKSKKKSKDHRHNYGNTMDLLDLGGP